MTRAASAVLAAALVALVWILLHLGWYPHGQLVDYPVYEQYGEAVVHAHQVPYRDFRLEYPPGALPTFVVPELFARFGFRTVFQVLMALCHLAAVLAVLSLRGRAAAAMTAVAPLLLGSVVISRFDLWPTALAILAVLALVRGRTVTSGVVLGTAFAAKLWPGALGPLAVIWLWRREGLRPALVWAGASLATAAAWFVPFAVLSPAGIGHSFYEQLGRPLQVESLGASVLLAVHLVFHNPLGTTSSFGSQNLIGPGVHEIGLATTVLEVLVLLLVWSLFAHGRPTTDRLLTAAAATVAALLAFGKVFSPQYLIWLFPFAPLACWIAAPIVCGAALVLTQAYFPRRYWPLVLSLRDVEVGVLLVRNLLVVALLALLTAALARRAAPAGAVSAVPEPRATG